jgi:hypothetical protein
MSLRRFSSVLAVVSVSALAVACDDKDNIGSVDGTLHTAGYALFSVDNSRQQRDDAVVTVRNVTPGQTYVLFYSGAAPKNAGWFLFDPKTKERCGGDVGDHCKVDGYGWMVDQVTVPDNATEVVLRDERCGCNGDREYDDWTGHWAVMRIERATSTTPESPIHFEVQPHKISSFTAEPDISQLQ